MRALDILLSGRWVKAAEALRIGLATSLAPLGDARRMAAELAKRGPLAVRYAKEAVAAGSDMTLAQGIRLEQDLYVLLQTTADRQEGVRQEEKDSRCWPGSEPTPGKKPGTRGGCKPKD